MRLVGVAVALFWVLVACDGGSGAGFGTPGGSWTDTGSIVTRSDLEGMGTQVGSEGFWGCPIEEVAALSSGREPLDALGGATPEALTAERIGKWTLQVAADGDTGGPGAGELDLVDLGLYLWVDVADGCTDHLAASVAGTVQRAGFDPEAVGGWVAVAADGRGRAIVTAADLDAAVTTWGAPELAATSGVTFRIDGSVDAAAFDGVGAYVDCPAAEAQCPTADVVATVTGAR